MFGQTHRMKLEFRDGRVQVQDVYIVRTRVKLNGSTEGLIHILETKEMDYFVLAGNVEDEPQAEPGEPSGIPEPPDERFNFD